MKLDRNVNVDKRGKYAIINFRTDVKGFEGWQSALTNICRNRLQMFTVAPREAVELGESLETEFFVIKLKDKYAEHALEAYAIAASVDDPENAGEVLALAKRAGANHPLCKKPD